MSQPDLAVAAPASIVAFSMSTLPADIDWKEYNYPPLLKIIHFRVDEISCCKAKTLARRVHYSFMLLLVSVGINLISAITQTFLAEESTKIILYSIVHTLIYAPIALFVFYQGYKAIALRDRKQHKVYMRYQTICGFAYLATSIISGGSFNGFTKTSRLFSDRYKIQASISLIESLTYLINAAFSAYIVLHIYRRLRDGEVVSEGQDEQKVIPKQLCRTISKEVEGNERYQHEEEILQDKNQQALSPLDSHKDLEIQRLTQ